MATNVINKEVLQALLNEIASTIATKADDGHKHEIADVNGLETALQGIRDAVGELTSFEIEIVDSVSKVTETGKIYFIASTVTPNVYDEYMFVNGKAEKIGNTHIDLAPYAKTADVNQQFETMQQAVDGKVAQGTYNTKIAEIEGNIDTVEGNVQTNADDIVALKQALGLNTGDGEQVEASVTVRVGILEGEMDVIQGKVQTLEGIDHTTYALKTDLQTVQGTANQNKTDITNLTGVVNTINTNKAEKSYVDTELGKKADKTYVDTELDKKANEEHNHDDVYLKISEVVTDTAVATTMWNQALANAETQA